MREFYIDYRRGVKQMWNDLTPLGRVLIFPLAAFFHAISYITAGIGAILLWALFKHSPPS